MGMSMASILVHSDALPAAARDALSAAQDTPPESRRALLESAARILHEEVGLGCRDALELVGLPGGDCVYSEHADPTLQQ
jgi:hypothetical protein